MVIHRQNLWTKCPKVLSGLGVVTMSHYKQIIINMACEDDLDEADLQILKAKIEECVNINVDPEKVSEVHVRVN